MYEFNYIAAANATVKDIKEQREKILKQLEAIIGFVPKERVENNPEEAEAATEKAEADNVKKDEKQDANQPEADEEEQEDPFESERKQTYIDIYHHIKNNFNVVIEVNKLKSENIKLAHIGKLIQKAKALKLPLNVYVSGYSQFGNETEHVDMLFSQNMMGIFIALDSFLTINGCEHLKFLEDPFAPELSWTLDQVLYANNVIQTVVDTIKCQNFTPLEAMAYVHYYLTSQFPYQENVDNPTEPRSIVGLLNTDSIVCVGYAKFVKAVVDKLSMKDLSAETITSVIKPHYLDNIVKMVNKYTISGFAHAQNLITLKDPKYYVAGTYMEDACWDTKTDEFVNGKGFGNFLYSIQDAFHYAGFTYQQIDSHDNYDATKVLQSEYIIPKHDQTFYKNAVDSSKPISSETLESAVYSMIRKMFPQMTKAQVEETTKYYMLLSKVVASSIFDKDAKSPLAKEGRKIQEEYMKKLGAENSEEVESLSANEIMR